jgi:Domain of unknown function (DUF4062)
VNEGVRAEVVIRTPDQRLRVFVSSTLGELAEERQAVSRAIAALRLTPVLFEAGARPYPPRALYQAYLAKATSSSGCTGSATGRSTLAWRCRGWRRSSSCLRGCRGCCMSRCPRPTGSRALPSCWLASVDQDQWAERLQAEMGNLAAAVEWYLANDPAPLPHLFRVLWMFWGLRDHLGEARAWVDQLLPTADSLDPQARAELRWTAAVTALEVVGDDAAALAARERLAPLVDGIQDPYLHAVAQVTMAGISAVVGDFDSALREELVSLEQLRGQDEPFWTAVAVLTPA